MSKLRLSANGSRIHFIGFIHLTIIIRIAISCWSIHRHLTDELHYLDAASNYATLAVVLFLWYGAL